jgi:hypothetical protein
MLRPPGVNDTTKPAGVRLPCMSASERPSSEFPTRWALLFAVLALLLGAGAVIIVGGELVV